MSKVNFYLDEAAQLGKMDAVDNMIAIGRGYGIRGCLIYQSLGQLKRCFPNGQDETILASTSQIYFAVNDNATAEYVSKRLGDQTIIVEDGGSSGNSSYGRSSGRDSSTNSNQSIGTSRSWKQSARRLLHPNEIMAMSPRVAITFAPGMPPIRTWLLRYYQEKWLTRRSPLREKLNDWSKFMRAAVLCGLFMWLAVFLTPGAVTAWRVLMKK